MAYQGFEKRISPRVPNLSSTLRGGTAPVSECIFSLVLTRGSQLMARLRLQQRFTVPGYLSARCVIVRRRRDGSAIPNEPAVQRVHEVKKTKVFVADQPAKQSETLHCTPLFITH